MSFHVPITRDVAQSLLDSLRALREAGVYVWPNHPMNPETALREALKPRPPSSHRVHQNCPSCTCREPG